MSGTIGGFVGLADDIKARNKPPAPICIVCRVIEEMKADDRADLESCLADDQITGAAIASILAERGWPINPDGKQVRRHRHRCAS